MPNPTTAAPPQHTEVRPLLCHIAEPTHHPRRVGSGEACPSSQGEGVWLMRKSPLGHQTSSLTSGFLMGSTCFARFAAGHGRGGSSPTGTRPTQRTRVRAVASQCSVAHQLSYRLGRLTGIFMLQDPDCRPARGSESDVGVAVTTRRPLLRRRERAKGASQSSCHCQRPCRTPHHPVENGPRAGRCGSTRSPRRAGSRLTHSDVPPRRPGGQGVAGRGNEPLGHRPS
jgi:hypothetical protein